MEKLMTMAAALKKRTCYEAVTSWHKKYGGMEVPAPDSGSCWPESCRIRRRFRWIPGESTDDRPEAGGRGVDV